MPFEGMRRGVDERRILDDAKSANDQADYPPFLSHDAARVINDQMDVLTPENYFAVRAAVGVAMDSMRKIDASLTPEERERRRQLAQLMDPRVATLAGTVPDRIFRPDSANQQWLAMMEIVSGVGMPKDLSLYEKAGLITADSPLRHLVSMIPGAANVVMSMARNHILKQVGGFVNIYKDGSAKNMISDLESKSAETGIGYEANLVTESARTTAEAKKNLEWYKAAIRAGAKRIAIKPTSIVPFSDSALARPVMKKKIAEALKEIFEVANEYSVGDADGNTTILSVDSERSDIVDMVAEAFIDAAREFPKVRVQIAVQAYLNDSEKLLLDPVLEASKKRKRDQNGEPMGARLVNGANQEGEEWLKSAMGWERTPLVGSRAEAHANYMRLRRRMIDPIKDGDFTLTVGTMNMITLMNNLQELAKAGVFASRNAGYVHFAMLNGMTGQECFRFLKERYNITAHEYVPVIPLEAIVELFKYYLRRIEELASKLENLTDADAVANYLGVTAKYGTESPEWLQTQVVSGIIPAMINYQNHPESLDPKIRGYRGDKEPLILPRSLVEFQPAPSAAPGSYEDSEWIDDRIKNCKGRTDEDREKIELSGRKGKLRKVGDLKGPTRPDLLLAQYELADEEDIDDAITVAANDPKGWGKMCTVSRMAVLTQGVRAIKDSRGEMVESLMLNSGKPILEADEEVSEAMDFLNLALLHTEQLGDRKNLESVQDGNGVATVICPKNFPQAIPLAHTVARLLAGYRVIVKPSGGEGEESVLSTYKMCEALWQAGVPKEALVFLPCDNKRAAYLTKKSERIGYTGSNGVAEAIQLGNPEADLIAETGGRNFIIVSGDVDLKTTATEILKSMCGFGGQKCSKPVAVILTKDVNLEEFKAHLLGQMQEFLMDTALNRVVDVPPLSREYSPEHPFYNKVMECLPGEEWMVQPSRVGAPGVRFIKDAANFDFAKIEEIFAPIISIAQIDGGVNDAVDIVNSTKGSLTGALFAENRDDIMYALGNWETGNLYIRRGNTGAKAHQGFGDGPGDSHRGAHGAKTGTIEWQIMNSSFRRKDGAHADYDKDLTWVDSEDYNAVKLEGLLGRLEAKLAKDAERLKDSGNSGPMHQQFLAAMHAGWSYLYENARHFSKKRPAPYQTKGQYDWIESHRVGDVILRVSEGDDYESILGKMFATIAAGNSLRISVDPAMRRAIHIIEAQLGCRRLDQYFQVEIVYETDEEMFNSIGEDLGCLMYADKSKVPHEVYEAAAKTGLHIDARPVTGDGLVDMVTQFRQQSYCWVYHVAGDTGYEEMIRQNHPEQAPYDKED